MAKKILLVEDDKVLAQMYLDKLAKSGLDVVVAHTGGEALTRVKSLHPDLILLDIMLPGGMNGFDVLRQLKFDQKLKPIPVIIMTNLDSEKKTAFEYGAKDYFIKTEGSMDELVKRVKKHLKGWL